jgi:hypothetical protein
LILGFVAIAAEEIPHKDVEDQMGQVPFEMLIFIPLH